MPLKCLNQGVALCAFDVTSQEEWEDLRVRNRHDKILSMDCCGASAVLKTSKLGTRYFAHARRGPCNTAPETAEHLLAKAQIVAAIQASFWQPLPEQSGVTPAGESWRADVMAIKDDAQVIFEVQWSRQSTEDSRVRHARYIQSGVQAIWLFRQGDLPVDANTPAFRLLFLPEEQRFDVLMPGPWYEPAWANRAALDAPAWGQRIALDRFVRGVLQGGLQFAPSIGRRMPIRVETTEVDCWKCHRPTNIVMDIVFEAGKVLPGHHDIPISMYEVDDYISTGAADIAELLPYQLLQKHGVGFLKPRYSRTAGGAYLSNGCIHCDAIQGRFFEHEYVYDPRQTFWTEGTLKTSWSEMLLETGGYAHMWWFNEGVVQANQPDVA